MPTSRPLRCNPWILVDPSVHDVVVDSLGTAVRTSRTANWGTDKRPTSMSLSPDAEYQQDSDPEVNVENLPIKDERLIEYHRAMFKPLQATINFDVGLRCSQPINYL